jgi:hypothetical protein
MSERREHPIARWMRVNKIDTQAIAAERLGLTQQEVSDYSTWKHVPRPAKMRKIATAIKCPLASLIPDVEESVA